MCLLSLEFLFLGKNISDLYYGSRERKNLSKIKNDSIHERI